MRISGKVGPDGIDYLLGGGAKAKAALVLNHPGGQEGDSSGFSWLVAFSSSGPSSAVGEELALPAGVDSLTFTAGGEKYAQFLIVRMLAKGWFWPAALHETASKPVRRF